MTLSYSYNALRQISEIASRYKDSKNILPLLQILDERALQGSNKPLVIGVVGAFSRGKSSLINLILGKHILPASVLPSTAIPTKIIFGEKNSLTAFSSGKELFTKEIRYLNKLTAAFDDDIASIDYVQVELNSELLSKDIVVIDTPGIGAVYSEHFKKTKDTLLICDAAICVFSTDPLLSEVECKFIEELTRDLQTILFVQTKIDLHNDWLEKLHYNEMALRSVVPSENIKIFALSCINRESERATSEVQSTALVNIRKLKREIFRLNRTKTTIIQERNNYLLNKLASFLEEILVCEINNNEKEISKVKTLIIKLDVKIRKTTEAFDSISKKSDDLERIIKTEILQASEEAKRIFADYIEECKVFDQEVIDSILSRSIIKISKIVKSKVQYEVENFKTGNKFKYGEIQNWNPGLRYPVKAEEKLLFEKVFFASKGKTGLGAVIGGGIGTLLLPGLGTIAGATLGAVFGSQVTDDPIVNEELTKKNILQSGYKAIDNWKRKIASYWSEEYKYLDNLLKNEHSKGFGEEMQVIESKKKKLTLEVNNLKTRNLTLKNDLKMIIGLKQ